MQILNPQTRAIEFKYWTMVWFKSYPHFPKMKGNPGEFNMHAGLWTICLESLPAFQMSASFKAAHIFLFPLNTYCMFSASCSFRNLSFSSSFRNLSFTSMMVHSGRNRQFHPLPLSSSNLSPHPSEWGPPSTTYTLSTPGPSAGQVHVPQKPLPPTNLLHPLCPYLCSLKPSSWHHISPNCLLTGFPSATLPKCTSEHGCLTGKNAFLAPRGFQSKIQAPGTTWTICHGLSKARPAASSLPFSHLCHELWPSSASSHMLLSIWNVFSIVVTGQLLCTL